MKKHVHAYDLYSGYLPENPTEMQELTHGAFRALLSSPDSEDLYNALRIFNGAEKVKLSENKGSKHELKIVTAEQADQFEVVSQSQSALQLTAE